MYNCWKACLSVTTITYRVMPFKVHIIYPQVLLLQVDIMQCLDTFCQSCCYKQTVLESNPFLCYVASQGQQFGIVRLSLRKPAPFPCAKEIVDKFCNTIDF